MGKGTKNNHTPGLIGNSAYQKRMIFTMAKQKLRLTLAGSTMQAPIWPKDDILWEGSKIGCPYCSELKKTKPLVDVIQYGLIDHDMVITVFECRGCKKRFGVKYVIPHGHELDESEAHN